MKLEETILECYKDYKSVVDSNPDDWITFKGFTLHYKKDDNGEWKKTEEKKLGSNILKMDGTYFNSIYQKYRTEKNNGETRELEDWFIGNLPKEKCVEAKEYIDEKVKEQKYCIQVLEAYQKAIRQNPFELITFKEFTTYYKNTNGIWKKTKETKPKTTTLKKDGTYFNTVHNKHRLKTQRKKETRPFEVWFIDTLPIKLQKEAKELLDEKSQEQRYYTQAYHAYKTLITENSDEPITLTQFTLYYKTDEKGEWKKTEEKNSKKNKLKTDGTYHNSIYEKYHYEKTSKTINEWLIKKLPATLREEAKETLDEKVQEQRYITKIYADYKNIVETNLFELITFKEFIKYYKRNENKEWKKTEEKWRNTRIPKTDGTYFNQVYNKHQSRKRHGEKKPLEDWFISLLPSDLQPEASYYLKGGYLTDKLKALK